MASMTTTDQRHDAAPVPAGWTKGPLWMPEPLTVTDRILARAAAHPDRPAIEQRGQVLSYAELVGRAGCLARVLRGHGVGPESRVGVCLRRTPAMPVAALGVLLAGGAYVPVSPDDPDRRRAMVLDDAGVTVSVVDDDGRTALDGRVPTLVEAARAAATGSDGETWPSPHRGQAAYVLYTSGSTGRPKGVVVEHGALADFVGSVAAPAGIDEHTRSLGFAALGFDVSVLDLLVPLAFGGLVVLAGEGDRADPARLELLCREYRVNWAAIPPALLPVVSPDRIPTLRRVVTAGEAPTPGRCGATPTRPGAPSATGTARPRCLWWPPATTWTASGPRRCPWAVRCRGAGPTSSMPRAMRCPWAAPASCVWAEWALPAATWAARG